MIRITQSMQIARTLRDQNLNLERMNDYSFDMSSGVNLHRPSDDPIRVARAMRIMAELSVNSTYKADLEAADSWSSKSNNSLNTLGSILKRVGELTTQASSGDLTAEDKQKIQMEIKELKASAVQIGNDDYMGRYQFSGYKTDKKFVLPDGKYNTELNLAGLKYERIDYNIGVGQKTQINLTGVEVFGNEYFGTTTRASEALPFSDDLKSLLAGNMSITLQKYEQPQAYYDMKPGHTPGDATAEDKENNQKEEAYEKTTKLTKTLGPSITIDNVAFYGSYAKGDVNAVVEDLNKSLRKQIDEQFKADPAKAAELKQAVQFVNADGKISMITDRDYAGKIQAKDVDLSKVAEGTPLTSTPAPNANHEIGIETKVAYGVNPVKEYFNFDLELTQYKRDKDGNIDPANVDKVIELKDIVSTNAFTKPPYKDDAQIQEYIKNELQNKINNKLMEKGLPESTIRVNMDNGQPSLIVDRQYGVKLKNDTTQIANASSIIADSTHTPKSDPKDNPMQIIDTGIGADDFTGKDTLVSLNFNLDITKYKTMSGGSGDILISNPNVTPTNPPNPADAGKLDLTTGKTYNLGTVSLTKVYDGKYADGTPKKTDDILREVAKDLENKINENAAYANPPMENPGAIRVEAKDGKINILINGNVGHNISNVNNSITQNTFKEVDEKGKPDTLSNINLKMPTLNPTGDTNVYMNLNLDIANFEKDKKGNSTSNLLEPHIKVDGIKLNKTYPRLKPDGTSYTDEEIKTQIFDDIKKQIKDKLGELNPPLAPNAINVERAGDDIVIKVYPDIKVTAKIDDKLPDSLKTSAADQKYIPNKTADEQPTREMMPFFEMMDRLMKFMEEGNSKGLSRMLDVIDYHAKNNQKNQGIGGARAGMYKVMLDRTEDIKLNYTDLLSNTRDTDYNELSMKMSVAANVYRASLAVTAKLIQPSLVDFLR